MLDKVANLVPFDHRTMKPLGNPPELIRGLSSGGSQDVDPDEVDVRSPLDAVARAIDQHPNKRTYMRALTRMPLAVDVGFDTVVAHAGFAQNRVAVGPEQRRRAVNAFCYGRRTEPFAGVLVTGHNTVESPRVRLRNGSARVLVDTGCHAGGVLTAFKVGASIDVPSKDGAECELPYKSYLTVPCNPGDRRR